MKTILTIFAWLCIQTTTFAAGPPEKKPTLPEPTAEIKILVADLGNNEYKIREAASLKLIKLGYRALKACMDAQKSSDLEIARRADRIVTDYYNVWCRDNKLPSTPGIWCLPDEDRFPLGVEIVKDTDEPDTSRGEYLQPDGWCKEMVAKKDVAANYFRKARKAYNDRLKKEELAKGFRIDEGTWANDMIEKEAMSMYVHDLLYHGKNRTAMQKKVDEWAKLSTTHKCMHRHYGGGSLGSVIPGPLVPKEEVPEGSENRFQGWGG